MKKESVLAGSSYWVPGSWVFNFEKQFTTETKNGNQSATRTKTGNQPSVRTRPRTRTDPKTRCIQFLVLHFLNLKIQALKLFFPPFPTEARHVIGLRKKSGFGIIRAPIF